MRERRTDVQPSMDGGLNTVSDDILVSDRQLRKTINARLTDYGAVTKRGGTQRLTSAVLSAHAIQNGYTWRKDGGTQEMLAVSNGVLRTATYGSFPITFTAESGSLSTSVTPTFAQFRDGTNDVVYIADGGALNRWDGTTLTTNLAGTATCEAIVVHNERLWGGGNASFPDSIFYSALNDGDTLGDGANNGGQIVVRTFGDETVVGLASVNTSLLIFHRRGISRLTGFGQDDITVAPEGVTSDVGTIAKHSIVSVGNLAYFVSERGVYRCNESDVAPVGTKEMPDPLLPILRTLSVSQFDTIRTGWNRQTREVWFSIPTIGVYVYHTILNAWAGPFTGAYENTTALFETLDAAGLPVLIRGDTDGWLSVCDAPSTNMDNVSANGTGGTNVDMLVQFHRFYCFTRDGDGGDAEAKALRWGYLTAKLSGSSSTSVAWASATDAASYALPPSTGGVWGSGTWGVGAYAGASSQNYRVPMWGTGYHFDVQIIDSGTGLPVFSRFELDTFALGRR
jgi:hypothetical protein